ncbi:MAG TPA: hypothetical protein VLL98_01495 [Rickettsiales bacterium]|nr:hypothetical protein [Rickettsiales bacterium]
MNKDLVKFMDTENNTKRTNDSKLDEINLRDTSLYNIRKNDEGLYFNLKISGIIDKNITNLFIPSRFYEQINSNQRSNLIIISKAKLVEYFLVYPGAVASLVLIISTFFRYLPTIRNFFNISGF